MMNRYDPALQQAEAKGLRDGLIVDACAYFMMNICFLRNVETFKTWDPVSYTLLCALLVLPETLLTYGIAITLPEMLVEIYKILSHDVAKQEARLNRRIASATTNQDKLEAASFPDDLIPDEFRCDMGKTIMTTPVKLTGTPQIYDQRQLQTWLLHLGHAGYDFAFRNPGSNTTIRYPDDVHIQWKLLQKIQTYVDTVIQQIQIIRQQRSQHFFVTHVKLSQNDYRIIHEHAMRVVQDKYPTPSLTLRR